MYHNQLPRIYNLILTSLLFFCGMIMLTAQPVEIATIERYPGIEETKSVNAILVDEQNQKWIGTDAGLFKINSFYQEVEKITDEAGVRALAITRNGQEWAGREDHKVHSSDLRYSAVLELADQTITSLAVNGEWLWVGTTNGIYTISLADQRVASHYTSENSKLGSNQINALLKDRYGIMWVGTDEGLVRVSEKGWKVYEKKSKVTALSWSSEGTWVACDRQTWLIDKHNRWYPIAINKRLSKGIVRGLANDREGRLYIASEILVQYNPYDEVINQYDEEYGYVNAEAMSIAADSLDDIWVGTADRGLFRIEFSDELTDRLTALINVVNKLECDGDTDGAIAIKVRGGTEPFRYLWAKDGLVGPELSRLGAGTYTVTVTDDSEQLVVLSTTLEAPPALAITVTENERISGKTVKDGKAAIAVTGGTPEYKYLWNTGATVDAIKRLTKGKYTVSVTDALGCKAKQTIEILKERAIPDLVEKKLEVGQTLTVNELYFEADSVIIAKASFPSLNEVHDFLKANPNIKIEIGGHTNSLPADEYCDRLSTARANNVANYLYQKGIPKTQLSYKGYGKRNPVASNRTDAGRKRNQRVEIKVLSISG